MKDDKIVKEANRFIRIKKIKLAMKTWGMSVADISAKQKIELCHAHKVSSTTLNNDIKIIEKIDQLTD